jgi:sugar phosphate isomerase/epimerase
MTRRSLVASLAAAPLVAKPFPKPIGVQLYTARTLLAKDPEGTLKRIAAIGYQEVELYAVEQIDKLVPVAKGLGMKATSIHIPAAICLGENPSPFENALAKANEAGIAYAGVPYVAPNDRGSSGVSNEEFWSAWSKKMNRAAGIADKAGIKFFYHHHAFEFVGAPGTRPIDYMRKFLDPKVKLELDVFWVAAAGLDPIDTLDEWKDRVALMHVKDKAPGMAAITTESQAKPADFKEVGAGTLDFKKLLNEALKSGVDKFYVEQDQCPGDPVDSLAQSFGYLKKLSL